PPTVVARKILIYSYLMVAATLALAPYAGWLYTACAAGLGGWFLLEAHRLQRRVAVIARTSDGQPAAAVTAPAAGRAADGQGPAVTEGARPRLAQPTPHPPPLPPFPPSLPYPTPL